MKRRLLEYLDVHHRTYIAMSYDMIMAGFSFLFSIILPFTIVTDFYFPNINYLAVMALVLISQGLSFFTMGMYRGIWRFSSTPDLIRVLKGVTLGVSSSFIAVFLFNRLENIPRSAFIIDWFILVVFLGGGRFGYRIWKDRGEYREGDKVLIVGAGAAATQLIREIAQNKSLQLDVVGLIDDDPRKKGKSLYGVNILGTINRMGEIIDKYCIEKVYIAIPSATSAQVRTIITACHEHKVEVQTLPGLSDLIEGKVELAMLRKVKPEDLLGREPVNLDIASIESMLTGKTILVTGAGGSIGSEICNQVIKFKPKMLVLYEQGELFLYELENKLKLQFPDETIVPIIGDVRNRQALEHVFKLYRPDVIFHAAAYKHVNIMEIHPIEAFRNNVMGTQVVADLASTYKAEKFVMISTDKAVNPTNYMGASKRIAEIVCQKIHRSQNSETKFMTVRFGNVLGSHGSVVPRFKEQIEQGGPVTVTHPEVNRYFMSIPEAAQLVMQAGAMGKGGEIFVLEMGEPIKIIDLAKQMIRLAGFTPYEEIDIEITGLRPGEKLYEELLSNEENTLPTDHQKVRVAEAKNIPTNIEELLLNISSLDYRSTENEIKQALLALVPEYAPQIIEDIRTEGDKVVMKSTETTH